MAAGQFAKEGRDFEKFAEGSRTNFVCKLFPCVEIFGSSHAYHNHALFCHNLFQEKIPVAPDKGKKKKAVGNEKGPKRKRASKTNKANLEGEGSIFCEDYPRLRGNCPVRWRGTKKEKRASFLKKAIRFFELVYGPQPPLPNSDLYIEILQRALPLLGYSAWDSLLDEKSFHTISKWVTGSVRSNTVHDWCSKVQGSLPTECPESELMQAQGEWHKSHSFCRHLKRIFKKRDWGDDDTVSRTYPTRDLLVEGATRFLQQMRDRLQWEIDTAEDKVQARAEAAYQKWKLLNKEGILALQRQNCYYTLTTRFKMTHDKAVEEGMLEVFVRDSSDGEDVPPTVMNRFQYEGKVNEQSQHVDEVPLVEEFADVATGAQRTKTANRRPPRVKPRTTIKPPGTLNFSNTAIPTVVPDTEDEDDAFQNQLPRRRLKLRNVRAEARMQGGSRPCQPSLSSVSEAPQPEELQTPGSNGNQVTGDGGALHSPGVQGREELPLAMDVAQLPFTVLTGSTVEDVQLGPLQPCGLDNTMEFSSSLFVPSQLDEPSGIDFLAEFDSLEQ